MKNRHCLRKALSLLLIFAMVFSMTGEALAEELATTETVISGSRLTGENAPEGNAVYFGTTAVSLPETRELYRVKLYRDGDTSTEASVTIRSYDVSAVYGEDYALIDPDSVTGDGTTMRELSALQTEAQEAEEYSGSITLQTDDTAGVLDGTAEVSLSNLELSAEDPDITTETAELSGDTSGDETGEADAADDDADAESDADETATLNGEFTDAMTAALTDDYLATMSYSSEETITFAAGETEQELLFLIKDDNESEGTEGFSLMMIASEGVEPYTNISFAVSIEDDEPAVHSTVSFGAASYTADSGAVTVTVTRSGAEYSMASAVITGTDVTGETQTYGEVAFAPYVMEQEVSLEITRPTTLTLTDLKAADAGEITEAAVEVETETVDAELSEDDAAGLLADESGNLEFNITIKGKEYLVQYTAGNVAGVVLDQSYSPAVEVGVYYFPTAYNKNDSSSGMFVYNVYEGDNPGSLGWRHSFQTTDGDRPVAQLEYYSPWTWDTGNAVVRTTMETSKISAGLFRYVFPEWSQDRTIYGGQSSCFQVSVGKNVWEGTIKSTYRASDFDQNADYSHGAEIKNQRGLLNVAAKAVDDEGWMTPKIRTRLYGVVALYKQYRITTTQPTAKSYLSGSEDSKTQVAPLQISIEAGAQVLYDDTARDVYLHMDPTGSGEDTYDLVFTLGTSTVNGKTDTFGEVTGYNITVTPQDPKNAVTVEYPKQYIEYLQSTDRKTVAGGADYSADKVKAVIERIYESMDTVTLDLYFEEWIESVQKTVCSDSSLGYDQQLSFQPIVAYQDVSVTVTAPFYNEQADESMGHFNWDELDLSTLSASQTNRSLSRTFHAGDCLDLSATAGDGWQIVGYEYSVNGGKTFDGVKSKSSLVLQGGNSYIIRPLVAKDLNYIEIAFADETAEDNLSIESALIPQNELPQNLKGKNILNLNPTASNVEDKMNPEVGGAYTVSVSSYSSSYRPVFKNPITATEYQTDCYYQIAGQTPGTNRIVLRAEKVSASGFSTYTVTGTAMISANSIYADGLGAHNSPATGYSALMSADQTGSTVACQMATVNSKTGEFTLSGIKGKKGDRIPVLLDNGIYDAQVFDVVLGSDTTCDLGVLKLRYPDQTPKVAGLTYKYLSHTVNLISNRINVYTDDTLTLTATVDTAGRTIKKVVFVVKDTLGDTTEYTAEKKGNNVYAVDFTDLSDISSGDRIYVYLVDGSGHQLTTEDGKTTLETVYPTVDTGLCFIVENELIKPKNFSIDATTDIDIPLLGQSAAKVESGKIGLTRTDWADNTGYSLIMNASLMYDKGFGGQDKMLAAKDKLLTAVQTEQNRRNQLIRIASDERTGDNQGGYDFDDNDLDGSNLIGSGNDDIYTQETASYELKQKLQKQDSSACLTQDALINFGIIFCLDFEFIFNPEKNEYQLAQWAVVAGGSFSIFKCWYTMVGYVPCFVNITGAVQADLTFGDSTDNAAEALSQSTFDNYSGNIRELLENNSSGFMVVNAVSMLKVQIGAGMCCVCSARGYASLGWTTQLILMGKVDPEKGHWGNVLSAEGGFGIDLVLTSIDIPIAKISKGWGTLAAAAKVEFLGGVGPTVLLEDDSGSDSDSSETITARAYASGSSDMSDFGTAASLMAQPEEVSRTVLKDDAAERTRPQLLDLGDGRAFLVFIGSADRDELNDACLYYTIRDENGTWSTPLPVEDDGTYDSMPTLLRCRNTEEGEDSVVIAWMDADRVYGETDDFRTRYNAFGITAAAYDLNTGTLSSTYTVEDNQQYNSDPLLSWDGTRVTCSYVSEDLTDAESVADLISYDSMTSSSLSAVFTLEQLRNQEQGMSSAFWNGQQDLGITVSDYDRKLVEVDDNRYQLTAYTMYADGEDSSTEDQKLYLSICTYSSFGPLDSYPAICLADENTPMSPKVTDLGDQGVFVTWITSDGMFHMLDASEMLAALFADGVETEISDANWYQLNATEADFVSDTGETAEEKYEGSIYQELSNNEFRTVSASLSEDGQVTISEYQLATDGTDIYVFFVAPNTDLESTGTDLYGMRYRQGSSEEGNDELVTDSEMWGFTEPVAITHDDYVIDEFSLFVTEDRGVELVSNYFRQSINDEGKIVYSDNQLVNISFEAAGSLSIEENSMETDDTLVPGKKAQLRFAVTNNGLFPAEGFTYQVTMTRPDGTTVDIASGTEDMLLDSGETRKLYIPWVVPENINDATLTLEITEQDTTLVHTETASISLNGEAKLAIDDVETALEDGTLILTAQLENYGNQKSEQGTLLLTVTDSALAAGSVAVPALDPGQQTTLVLKLPLQSSWFDSFGRIPLELQLQTGDTTQDTWDTTWAVSRPVVAAFENDMSELSLRVGDSRTVTAAATPWSGLADEVVYTSDHPEIATVDQDTGLVYGVAAGTATITASFPEQGLTAVLTVHVKKALPFKDVTNAGAYYYDAVSWATEKGITLGVNATHFAPTGTTTRAQMVTFLWRAAGSPEAKNTTCSFTDVPKNSYYYKAVLWAVEQGITKGTTDTTFRPDREVTRAEAVTFLARMAGVQDGAAGYTQRFTDVTADAYYSAAVAWAYENGVTTGTTDTTFSPNATCQRAQVVTFLYRYFQTE